MSFEGQMSATANAGLCGAGKPTCVPVRKCVLSWVEEAIMNVGCRKEFHRKGLL